MKSQRKTDMTTNGSGTGGVVLTQVFCFIILNVFPLMIGSDGYYNLTAFKQNIWTFFAVAYWICCIVFLKKKDLHSFLKKENGSRIPRMVILLYMLWWGISAGVSTMRADTWIGQQRGEGVLFVLLYGITFFLVSYWGEFTPVLIYGAAAMTTLFGTVSVLQTIGIRLLYPEDYDFWNTSFLGTIGHVDVVAAIISMTLPLLLCGFVLMETRKRWFCIPGIVLLGIIQTASDVDSSKIGLIAAFGAVLPFLVDRRDRCARTLVAAGILTGAFLIPYFLHFRQFDGGECPPLSYGAAHCAILAAAVFMVLLGAFLGRGKHASKFSTHRIHCIGYTVLAACAATAFVLVYSYTGENLLLSDASRLFHGELTENLGNGRGMIWSGALQIIKENPVFGCGPGTYLTAMDPYNVWGSLAGGDGVQVDFAHNDFLQIAACEGLVGLALYLLLLLTGLYPAFRNAADRPELVVLLAPVVGFLAHSFFSFSVSIVSPLFWVLFGMLCCCAGKKA